MNTVADLEFLEEMTFIYRLRWHDIHMYTHRCGITTITVMIYYRLRYVVHGRGCNPHRSLWRHSLMTS